jgi:hypothetical protein
MLFRNFGLATVLFLSGSAFAQTVDLAELARVSEPETNRVSRSTSGDVSARTITPGDFTVFQHDSDRKIYGFSVFYEGVNSIIPVATTCFGCGPDREYHFEFRNRARQDIHLSITDSPTEYLSHRMESYFYLFPRTVLPAAAVIEEKGVIRVTLPTGETVDCDLKNKTIVGGALVETAPIDLNPDRFQRKFAQVNYVGSGLLIRVNRRGGDPRLGTVATLTRGKRSCKVPSKLLFNQDGTSDVEFLFPTDAEFNEFLLKQCGFGLS